MAAQPGDDKKGSEDDIAAETMKEFVKGAVDAVFDDSDPNNTNGYPYDHHLAQQWITKIEEQVLDRCYKLKKPYKFICNCVVVKNVGAGAQVASSAHFSQQDGSVCEERHVGNDLWCAVNLYWLQL